MVIREKGVIILANSFLIFLFGYVPANELVGNKIEFLIPVRFYGGYVPDRTGYMDNPNKRSKGLGMVLFAARKDGTEFPVEVSLSNYKTGEESFAIDFGSDISMRKEIEREPFQQQEQLALINKQIEGFDNEL